MEHQIAAVVGADHVGHDDLSINGVIPAVSVSPGSVEELAAVLKMASDHGWVVAPAGGCTRQQLGGVPERVDILLRTRRLNHLEHYDPGDLTIGVGAGMIFADLQRTLAQHQQWLPYDAASLESATVGGLMATAASGPLKSSYGGLREFCIGVQFVTADGKIAKGGGRVVKNVAGYDLMKLLIGSYGSLAVITRANFKVFPRPRQTRTFACSFASLQEAAGFRDRILKSALAPICVELISPRAPEFLNDPRPPHDPDFYAPAQPVARPSAEWQIVLRAAGSDAVLARYSRELGSAVTRTLDAADEERLWHWISHFEERILQQHRNAMIVHTGCAIADVAGVAGALEKTAPDYNFFPALLGRAASGSLIAAFVPLPVDPPAAMQYANCASAFRALLPAGCSAFVAHCPKEAKNYFDFWGGATSDITLMRAVKQAMDPKQILNRGRFIV